MYATSPSQNDVGRILSKVVKRLNPASVIAAAGTAPFYRAGDLIQIIGRHGTLRIVAAGEGSLIDRELVVLTGEGAAIHAANAAAGLELYEGNALSYLKFFCSSLMGGEGSRRAPYNVVESLGGMRLIDAHDPQDMAMEMIALEEPGQPVHYSFEGYLEFKMNLLKAGLVVCERSGVTMLEDRHVGRLACCQ
jgi:hypothetical protein